MYNGLASPFFLPGHFVCYMERSFIRCYSILPRLCHDPASVVSRSCLVCVTILPQLCHDRASVVSRSCHVCDKIVSCMRAASPFLLDIHQLSNIFEK